MHFGIPLRRIVVCFHVIGGSEGIQHDADIVIDTSYAKRWERPNRM